MSNPVPVVALKQVAPFSLVPQNLRDAMELAKIIADSDLAPKDYRGKPGNVLIAVQMGQEVGLSPMAAIQSIAVINGKPALYGDVGKAILLAKGFIIEEDDIDVIKKTGAGRCKITRPGHPPCERTFSIANAKTAGLFGKQGPWTQYPERQMAWRAFWFAARDVAADLLKGLSGAEEVIDIEPRDITPMAPPTIAMPQAKSQPQVAVSPIAQAAAEQLRAEETAASITKTGHETNDKPLSDGEKAHLRMKLTAASLSEDHVQKKFGTIIDGLKASQFKAVKTWIANPA